MTFDIREEAVGIGQPDSVAKFGIIESVGTSRSDVIEDDYGIAVKADCFVDIVTGVDPSKFAGKSSGRIGEDVMRRGLGIGLDGKKSLVDSGGGSGDVADLVRGCAIFDVELHTIVPYSSVCDFLNLLG